MGTPGKTLDNMTKHLTEAEIEARAEAEAATMPRRTAAIKKPAMLKKDPAAGRYWTAILKRMDGFEILDVLDTEMLGVYCLMLSRWDQLNALCVQLMAEAAGTTDRKGRKKKATVGEADSADIGDAAGSDAEARLAAMDRIDALTSRLQTHEKTLLSYAEKLGLTPTGRVRLAQQRAKMLAAEVDPDGDLFGD